MSENKKSQSIEEDFKKEVIAELKTEIKAQYKQHMETHRAIQKRLNLHHRRLNAVEKALKDAGIVNL